MRFSHTTIINTRFSENKPNGKMNTREKINYYYYFYYDLKDKFSISEISKLLDTSVLLLGIKITEMRLRQCLHNVLKR